MLKITKAGLVFFFFSLYCFLVLNARVSEEDAIRCEMLGNRGCYGRTLQLVQLQLLHSPGQQLQEQGAILVEMRGGVWDSGRFLVSWV